MRFDKLRLTGFKSFVEPTEFIIEKGLTGVVGPNGCGKSNLVEALRWVMGESSYKNMRASGMDDVIFSGSSTRPSRNMAEVSLFLDNSDHTAPAAFNQDDIIQVARRIEREAGSAYKINNKDARAKDVQLLFADQSTGARSPSMVGQGRIGELIQAKPQARRALLEEAAGISGLHSRRHEAELRLRGAETNLERLDDVISELESQIESLKRQARQANRFRTLSREIRQAEATLLHLKWLDAKNAEAEGQSALATATSAVAQKAQAQMEAAKAQAAAQHKMPPLRQAEAECAAKLQRLTIARDQLDQEVSRLAARKREFEQRSEQLERDIAREKGLLQENTGFLVALDGEETTLKAAQDGSNERAAHLAEALKSATQTLQMREAALAEITEQRAEAVALRTQLERRIKELNDRNQRLTTQHQQSTAQLSDIAAKIATLPDPARMSVLVGEADAASANCELAVSEAEKALDAARENEQAKRAALSETRQTLNELEAEARAISKFLNNGVADLFPSAMDTLKVKKGFETALGAALGDDLEVSIDQNAPVFWAGSEVLADDPALPEGVMALGEAVTNADKLTRRLSQIGVVETAHEALALAGKLAVGQRIVARDGTLLRWDGLRAAADAPTAAAQRLAQKNRLAELDALIVEATKAKTADENTVQACEQSLRDSRDSERAARQAQRDAQQNARAARENLAAAERAGGEIAQRKAVLEENDKRLLADLEEVVATLAQAETALAAEPPVDGLDAQMQTAQIEVTQARAAFAEARANHDGLQRESEARNARLEAIGRERTSWIKRRENAGAQIAVLTERLGEAQLALSSMAETPAELDEKRRALSADIDKATAERSTNGDALAKAENEARAADKAATDAITALSEIREQRVRAEERLAAANERRVSVEKRIAEALNCAPHEAFAQTGMTAGDSLPEIDHTERKFERLKIERERLGAVNLRAEDEQSELVERLDNIVTERDDVINAIAELRGAISSLNKEGRERLLEAFTVVQGHFTRLFTHLFGGGTAELQLVESDDPLDAGLEIVARPPGKKPQTMTLLSGGEQALTAMALIFAVFLTNPAPICVLDEVDAPLDDHNVERFCDLMDEMVKQTDTRFVIITHNPITMARVHRLFGVTMAEQGVSQLVSVDLEQAEELREAS